MHMGGEYETYRVRGFFFFSTAAFKVSSRCYFRSESDVLCTHSTDSYFHEYEGTDRFMDCAVKLRCDVQDRRRLSSGLFAPWRRLSVALAGDGLCAEACTEYLGICRRSDDLVASVQGISSR
jgi:hypothetical protein